MDKFYNETLAKLENEIKEFEIEADCSIERIEAVIQLIIKCLSDVKHYVLKRGFKNMWEAVFADVGVALLAILNAVRIQRMKFV